MWETRDKLQQPDVIVNPNVQSYIENFIAHNGNQSEMIAILADNYQVRLHQIDAYDSILKKMGFNVLGDFESFITKKVMQSFNPSIVDTIFRTETSLR